MLRAIGRVSNNAALCYPQKRYRIYGNISEVLHMVSLAGTARQTHGCDHHCSTGTVPRMDFSHLQKNMGQKRTPEISAKATEKTEIRREEKSNKQSLVSVHRRAGKIYCWSKSPDVKLMYATGAEDIA